MSSTRTLAAVVLLLGTAAAGRTATIAELLPSGARLSHLTVQQQLPHDVVNAIVQDRVGFMWFGTEEGLARFDGVRFEVFKPILGDPTSLCDEAVTSLLLDSAGTLWIGTWGGGLDHYDAVSETFTHLQARPEDASSLQDDRVLALVEDRAGVLWVGTAGGLDRLDRTTRAVTHISAPGDGGPGVSSVWAVCEDLFENLWVGTSDGLYLLDRASGRLVAAGQTGAPVGTLPAGRVTALALDRLGRLWIATPAGLRVHDRGHGFLLPSAIAPEFGPLDTSKARSIFGDHDGTLWVGTDERGLFRVELASGRLSSLTHDPAKPESLGHNDVHALFEDHSGVLWIATHGAGVDKLDLKPAKFRNITFDFRDPGSLTPGRVWGFLEDRERRLWIATEQGLDRFEPESGTFIHLRHDPADPRSLPPGRVQRLALTTSGDRWAAIGETWLVRLGPDGGVQERHRLPAAEHGATLEEGVLALAAGPQGRLWLGTARGLQVFDPASGVTRPPSCDVVGSAADEPVTSILQGAEGAMWIGTDGGGLCRCDPSGTACHRFRADPADASSLSHNRVWALHEDAAGTVWVGTANGLNRFEPATQTFVRFQAREGFPSDSVSGVLSDHRNVLWLSTNRGLTRFDPREGTFRTYSPSDGLQANLANPGACLRAADGTLLFGGFSGFVAFDPGAVRDNPNVPRVVLRTFAGPDFQHRFPLPLSGTGELRLRHFQNSLSISFAALDYTDPGRNQYRHRLEGFDRRWVEGEGLRVATYTNLPPGSYVFKVQGSNNDGIWNEAGAVLPIAIAPPFWQTWWFQAGAIASLIALVLLWYRARIRRLEAERRTLERLVDERTGELASSRDQLAEHRDQLQQINEIVKAINSPHDFTDLLASLLAQMRIIPGVDKAAALVWDRDSRGFRFRAAWGWPMDDLGFIELTAEEARTRYEAEADEIYPDIFVARNNGQNTGEHKFRPSGDWRSMLIMRIRVEDRVEGYLILDSLRDENAFAERDVLLLDNLKEHIRSAFLKAQMLADLQALNAKKNEFLGMAAHDLRSPLGLVGAWAGMLMRSIQSGRWQPEKALRDLGRLVDVAEQMNRMVTELLDISAIESGKVQIVPKPEDLPSLLDECEHLFGRLAADKGIALTIRRASREARVLADRDRTIEVLSNLVSNAIKFTPAGGTVHVWCEAGAGEVATHVEDSGPGLSDDDLKAVFRRFGRLSARPTAGEPSTGLGLAIVKKIVEMHGGRVWATCEKGKGARFSFSLPSAHP
ncbi:MAG: ATP-binding protein [Thermoanaerobaculaceae bacterium]|nr:ATP-binding protein [Thermoanaerobaculaceae bacterium]